MLWIGTNESKSGCVFWMRWTGWIKPNWLVKRGFSGTLKNDMTDFNTKNHGILLLLDTSGDPMAFILVYLPHHGLSEVAQIALSYHDKIRQL
ncbi:hypothetical protein JOE21_000452 [Desmospora profundinema]|uniref:Uncharacterized protein n=1 Tax=Desmospora profundinema TaxID=1571184 RepID=A0ABU1II65_9BACL|nr:hypothetical protein [Desmospora profundinema]